MKIYSEELAKESFDSVLIEDLPKMIGWVEAPDEPNGTWDVTTADDGIFACSTQEIAHIMANTEEIKAMLLREVEK